MRRRLLQTVGLVPLAVLALGMLAAPAGAQDSISGGCTVRFNGVDARKGHSPSSAFEYDEGDVIKVVGTAPGPITGYDVFMKYGFLRYKAKSGTVTGQKTTWTGTADVDDYAKFGVGLYRAEGASTGTVCRGWAYIKINGPVPLATAAGAGAAVVALVGVAGMASAAAGKGTPGKGHRWRGSLFGLLAGAGAAVLLQQFAVVPMTPAVMVGVPLGSAALGLAIGWPKAAAAAAAG
ncbi:MAG: hypothetical protein AMXMBFR46_03290 [Acidimicrobiia bacterium]